MSRPRRRCKILTVGVPLSLAEWVDTEAEACGMNRNQFLNHTLQRVKDSQLLDRVERLERRVSLLEQSGPDPS